MWTSESGDQDDQLIQDAVTRLSRQVLTAAIATSSTDGPWIFTAYIAMDGNRLWFTSQESTRHVADIRRAPAVAVSLWSAPVAWGEELRGLQLRGRATEVRTAGDADAGLVALHNKFPGTQSTIPDRNALIGDARRTCMFVVEFDRGSLRDEATFGKGRFAVVWNREAP